MMVERRADMRGRMPFFGEERASFEQVSRISNTFP
jgi:hypothetical protein